MSDTEYIRDPTDRTRAIHTPTAKIAASIFVAPADADPLDDGAWSHIGFADPRQMPGNSGESRMEP